MVLCLREPKNPAKTADPFLTHYWLSIVMVGAPTEGACRASTTTGAFAPLFVVESLLFRVGTYYVGVH